MTEGRRVLGSWHLRRRGACFLIWILSKAFCIAFCMAAFMSFSAKAEELNHGFLGSHG